VQTALLFDIDNTLTPPREPLLPEMAEVLNHLSAPFHVAAGSDLPLVKDQFLEPLFKFGFRGRFDAFLSNGAIHYRCDYTETMSVQVVSEFNIGRHLGEDDYAFLIAVLKQTLEDPEFRLPTSLKVLGERIIDRGSMINFAPIGRITQETPESLANRKAFVQFDSASGYRQRLLNHLKKGLANLIEKRELRITLGGQTSFDIGIAGKDKTNSVRTLVSEGYEKVIFFGDALFEGGNDHVMQKFVEEWNSPEPCPLETIQVDSWKDTIARLQKLGFIRPGFQVTL
jgi:hydroxymethylpyrimidine pyrophosphatase-like HAD family hydrolase